MKYLNKITALVCEFLLIIPTYPLLAGEPPKNSFERFSMIVSVGTILVVSASIYFVAFVPLEASSDKYHGSRERRKARNNVPDMEIKEIDEDENGHPQVRLQDPNNPENFAILIWPNHENNPVTRFKQGKIIAFQPSAYGSGWLLRDDTGMALAFIPVMDNMNENHSALF